MAKFQLVKSETSVILPVFIQDSSSTTGAGLSGLTSSSSITGAYVKRNGTGVALSVNETASTPGTYQAPSTAAQVRIATIANMPAGFYELHFHNDLFTTADWVTIGLAGATNMAPLALEVQLGTVNINDGVRGGMTALPNAAADAAGGLVISDAGGLDIDQTDVDVGTILTRLGTPSSSIALELATVDSNVDAILTDTADMQPKLGTPVTDLSTDIGSVKTDTGSLNTKIPQTMNLSGAGNIGIDWANIENPTSSKILTNTTVGTVTDITNRVTSNVDQINSNVAAATRLALSANQIIPYTVDTVINGHTPTTTEFQVDDITEATTNHFVGRIVIWTTGVLAGQAAEITGYSLVGGIGQFTVETMTDAPSDNDTGVIL